MEKEKFDRAEVAQKEILTTAEVAVYLGMTKWGIDHLCRNRAIPYYRPTGKFRYFKRTEIDEWACRNRVKTYDELQAEAAKK